MKKINFNEIPGFYTGHDTDAENGTGVTVILAPEGALAGVDVRGGSPATRETDLLRPQSTVQEIHSVVLSGGSAFGLESSSGVMKYLKEKGCGYKLKDITVPIVVQASLFDLPCGNPNAYPDREAGYAACLHAEENRPESGCFGAGTGATVGKYLGTDKAMKSGIGMYACQIGDLQVGAIAAVNACGDVYMPDSRERLAGIYDQSTGMEANSEEAILTLAAKAQGERQNTPIGCIITNADLTKAQMTKLAAAAQNGLARTIHPVHTVDDGDTIFAMTTGLVQADLTTVSVMAVKAMAEAVTDAVKSAEAGYGLESWSSLQNKK